MKKLTLSKKDKIINSLQLKIEELEEIIKDKLYENLSNYINLKLENEKLRETNKNLRTKNKKLKEMLKK